MNPHTEKLLLNPAYQVELIAPDLVFLFSEKDNYCLEGKTYFALFSLLIKKAITRPELVEELKKELRALEVYYALECLEERGFVQEKVTPLSIEQTIFCHHLEACPQKVKTILENAALYVVGTKEKPSYSLLSALESNGFRPSASQNDATLAIVVCEDYQDPELFEIYRGFQNANLPCLLAKLKGSQIWVGPLLDPKANDCIHCLIECIKRNRAERTSVGEYQKASSPIRTPIGSLLATEGLGVHWLVTETFKWIVNPATSSLKTHLLSFDLLSSSISTHEFIPSTRCEECRAKSKSTTLVIANLPPLQLASRHLHEKRDGGYRLETDAHVFQKLEHHISPVLGIVHSLEHLKKGEAEEALLACNHTYTAGHNFSFENSPRTIFARGLRSKSGGKGTNDGQAKVGALCEALERYCGVFQGDEPCLQASYNEIKEEAIHPYNLLLFSEKQYADRQNFIDATFKVPEPISENDILDWTPVWSLTANKYKYLPTSFCYYNCKTPGKFTIPSDSNGCAAGSCVEEAILQGFFELIERDAVALWWYNRALRPVVDLTSCQNPYVRRWQEEYKNRGVKVWALDITSDWGIPTFIALSCQNTTPGRDIIFGAGTHFDPEIALLRAMTEMNQLYCNLPQNKEESRKAPRANEHVLYKWLRECNLENQTYLKGDESERVQLGRFPMRDSTDILQEIQYGQNLIEERGLEMLVLNQSRPHIDLAVVKVIIPGLRHFYPRFAPGRLYDVPAQLGWVTKPLREEDLNPFPIII